MAYSNIFQLTEEWKQYRHRYLEEVLRLDYVPNPAETSCSSCGLYADGGVVYRCKDCFHSPHLCRVCILGGHKMQPLHRIEVLCLHSRSVLTDMCSQKSGRFWSRTALADLGLVYHLGHEGRPCPVGRVLKQPITVVHTNGFHSVKIAECLCVSQVERRYQFIRAEWFPTSQAAPQTAFTFDTLDTYHHLISQGRTSALDYYNTLVWLTDGSGVNRPSVRISLPYYVLLIRL